MDAKSDRDLNLNQFFELLNAQSTLSFGEYVASKCKERNISGRQLADILGVERTTIQRILKGTVQKIDAKILLQISEFFDVSPNVLLSYYVSSSPEDSISIQRAKRAGLLTRTFDLKGLKEIGFIESISDYDVIESRILNFFDVTTLGEFAQMDSLPLFSRTRGKQSDKMLAFWLAIVYQRMRTIKNPNEYNQDRVESVIPLFRAATLDVENGFNRAIRTLYDCGVTVIVESYVKRTQIRGGTFIWEGKPFIFLTKYPNHYDTLWFSLLHELSHVLFDQEYILKGTGSHLSGKDPDLFEDPLIEPRANEFALAILLSRDHLESARNIIHLETYVRRAAEEWGVHPSIIYGMHCFNHPEDFQFYSKFRSLKADDALKFNYESWQKKSLQETKIELIKQLTS